MNLRASVRRHPGRAAALAMVAVGAIAFVVYWFGPQYLFIDRTVDEAIPSIDAGTGARGPGAAPANAGGRDRDRGADDGGALTLVEGAFRGLEHGASGRAIVIALADGSRFLRLENLATSNGPDLRVYLSDQPAAYDWFVYDDDRYVDLGALKGNVGSSNYEIPRDVDLADYRSAVVWCRRFSVGFAVAPLDPAP